VKLNHKEYSLVIGRFQCIPPHDGHVELIRTLLREGKNVCIALREADLSEKNPYTSIDRRIAFENIFKREIMRGSVKIIDLPDVVEVVYGRTPGWKIREVRLSENLESISGTKMRKKNEQKKNQS
jgi:nicotinamide mononucleotide adenylyltransferase